MDLIVWLQDLFVEIQKDGQLKSIGIEIDTLDNPGWSVKIDLSGTPLKNNEFNAIKLEKTDNDWIHCKVENEIFQGAGGPLNLVDIIEKFKQWVLTNEKINSVAVNSRHNIISIGQDKAMSESKLLKWLQKWYHSQCDEDWEHEFGVSMNRGTDSTWNAKIDLSWTKVDGQRFIEANKKRQNNDWFHCWVSEKSFYGNGGHQNLVDIIEVFQEWVESSKEPDRRTNLN